jgi:histone acetyltransferase 1
MTTMDAQEAKRRKLEAKMGGGPPPSFPSAVPVPARKEPQPSQPKAPPPATAAEEADPFVCDANDAVSFRLVRTAADMATAEPFEPEFTHQVFREDETIFGYKELRIDIFQSAHLFKTYVKVRFAEKVKSTLNPADDVIEALRAHFGEEMMTDEKTFLSTLEADKDARVPAGGGDVVAVADATGVGDDVKAVDVIRAFRLSDAAVYPWHARFEPLILFFIDGASAVDSEDDNWTLLCATRHVYTSDAERDAIVSGASDGTHGWSTAAFATIYEFFQYPDKKRARLSQIVVAPPFQRQGLGSALLSATRALATKRSFVDVTVEDPTPQLQRLRDVGDVRALWSLPSVAAAVRAAAVAASKLSREDVEKEKAPLCLALQCPTSVKNEARDVLKLCAPQLARCWEALLFLFAKKSGAPEDSPAAAAFTELVVRRLRRQHCADAQRDAGAKRVYHSDVALFASGGNEHLAAEKAFVMTKAKKGRAGGQAPDLEEGEDKQDPAEVLAEYFHETMSNLAWLASAAKI